MKTNLFSLFLIVILISMCKAIFREDDEESGNPLTRALPRPAFPPEEEPFDIYLNYPKDVANIENMYLKCEWYENDE
ncbi:hypothetical protein TcasGA2_TC015738 [Tribolium castaneum]|uniref:Uncharacterized protein n=1 Tax=Tribolium castaneum TaxID=7070 RepID=D2A3R2_TRICA|nr:hypothetical protein TcasGA2_TC015738 [Tribolium castaneum]